MDKIRVLLANHPTMVPEDLHRLLEEQDDMEVVGDCRGPMKILQETGRANADAVILMQEGEREPGLCSQLLAAYPDLIIMSVTPDLTTASMLQLASQRRDFENLSQGALAQTLREAIRIGH
jgi:DNA-binding NarL/FixJ family response regulator